MEQRSQELHLGRVGINDLLHVDHRFQPASDPELLKYVTYVNLRRAFGDVEATRNLAVCQTLHEESKNVMLARG